jgi:hypothetical protein
MYIEAWTTLFVLVQCLKLHCRIESDALEEGQT